MLHCQRVIKPMIRSIFAAIILFLTVPAAAQDAPAGFDLSNNGVRIEPDRRVMIVLAALEVGRAPGPNGEDVQIINTPLSAEGVKFRELLRSDLATLPADLRQRISTFLLAHKRRNTGLTDAEIVAPFISMAYALTPPPELADPVVTLDLPGNLLDVLDFAPLVRDFYRRSSISGNIGEYIKTYQKTGDARLRQSTREMVNEILSYLNTRPQLFISERVSTETQRSRSRSTTLRTVERRERERTFAIVPDLLAPVGTVNFVNVKDEYFVVVPAELPADRDLSGSEIRRGFIQFVIDPLVYGQSKDIEIIRPKVKELLDERRKTVTSTSPDVYLTIARSLAAAIDAKQAENVRLKALTAQARRRIDSAKDDVERKAIVQELDKLKASLSDETMLRLSEDYEKGAILSFYFAEQLRGFEDSGFDIASSMREMVASFDASKEADRLGRSAEARKRALAARGERRQQQATNIIVENPVTTRLVEIQKLIADKQYAKASAELKQLLEKNPSEPRIYYNVGRVSGLQAESIEDEDELKAKLLESKLAYENVLRTATDSTDRALLSLTFVALARIYEFFGDATYAIGIYERAIQLGPVAGGGHGEAMAAKARLIKDH
ncbi:MAG TPA: hypothetical protein PKD26_03720 [Pyrinomonadaceae bacterium]|nr:hypothetical protein [Pyrinomonadaceae bacterium]